MRRIAGRAIWHRPPRWPLRAPNARAAQALARFPGRFAGALTAVRPLACSRARAARSLRAHAHAFASLRTAQRARSLARYATLFLVASVARALALLAPFARLARPIARPLRLVRCARPAARSPARLLRSVAPAPHVLKIINFQRCNQSFVWKTGNTGVFLNILLF